jgi:hypothetical protein
MINDLQVKQVAFFQTEPQRQISIPKSITGRQFQFFKIGEHEDTATPSATTTQ